MNEFNDFNDIIVFYLRKIKIFLSIVIVIAVAFAGIKTLNGYKAYVASKENAQNHDTQKSEKEQAGEPLQKTVSVVVNVKPVIIDNGNDMASYITGAFAANQNNQKVTEQLLAEFLETEKSDNKSNRELLYQYGYILDKERNYTYNESDFISGMMVSVLKDNYVSIGFTSMNEERARKIANSYANALINEVEKQIGKFEYEMMEESVIYSLPSPSAGASPTRVISSSSNSVGQIMPFKNVIIEGIKGGIWGSLLGMVLAIIIVAVWYLSSKKIQKISDLDRDNLFYGIYSKKRGLSKWWYKMIYNLEGERRCFSESKEIADIVVATLQEKQIDDPIMIAGSVVSKKTEELYKALVSNKKVDFECVKFVFTDVESIKKCQCYKQVILVEEIGKTIKDDIKREIDIYAGYSVDVLGILLVE